MSLLGKIFGLVLAGLIAVAVIFAFRNRELAPEMLLVVLIAFSILAISAALVAIAFALQARRETAALSLLVEHAVDRLEQRHDADHARLVMAIAAFDARAPLVQPVEAQGVFARLEKAQEPLKFNDLANKANASAARSHKTSGVTTNVSVKADNAHLSSLIESALTANRFPLSLEPIFEMPSATVRGYIAYAQIEGRNIRRATQNMDKFEYELAFAAAKAARQLLTNSDAAPIFCSISSGSRASFRQFEQLFDAQPDLRGTLVFLLSAGPNYQSMFAVIQQFQDAGIPIAIEGEDAIFDSEMPIKFSHWFIDANIIAGEKMTENARSLHAAAGNLGTQIVALDSGDETQLVRLIDRDVKLVTSAHLSPPRLVRS